MTKIEINAFRTALKARKLELEKATRKREGVVIEASADELDRIQNAGELEYEMRTLERNSERLREVVAALERIELGTFGVCTACEEDINSRRLAAVPWAPFCIACQEATEQEAVPGETETPLDLAA